jgi:hypothetical protein
METIPKMARQERSQVKSMLIIFCYMKGIVDKEFVLAVPAISSTYCCHVLW